MHVRSLIVLAVAGCGGPAQTTPVASPPPPPVPVAPVQAQAPWYCFTSVPFNAECVREEPHCTTDANEMRGYKGVKSVTACQAVQTVYCHQFADDPNSHPLCYPSPEYCENGRKIMAEAGAQSVCVTSNGGLVPPPPPQPRTASKSTGAWWCFTTEHPFNAECVPEQEHCQKDAVDMRGYSGATVSDCSQAHTMYCHHYKDEDDSHALCYPSPAHCENGRKLMGEAENTPCVKKDV
jgi:hypothetical protein